VARNQNHQRLRKDQTIAGEGGVEMSLLGRLTGVDELKADLKKRVDELLQTTQKMLEANKEETVALKENAKVLKEHTQAIQALRLSLKEIGEKL